MGCGGGSRDVWDRAGGVRLKKQIDVPCSVKEEAEVLQVVSAENESLNGGVKAEPELETGERMRPVCPPIWAPASSVLRNTADQSNERSAEGSGIAGDVEVESEETAAKRLRIDNAFVSVPCQPHSLPDSNRSITGNDSNGTSGSRLPLSDDLNQTTPPRLEATNEALEETSASVSMLAQILDPVQDSLDSTIRNSFRPPRPPSPMRRQNAHNRSLLSTLAELKEKETEIFLSKTKNMQIDSVKKLAKRDQLVKRFFDLYAHWATGAFCKRSSEQVEEQYRMDMSRLRMIDRFGTRALWLREHVISLILERYQKQRSTIDINVALKVWGNLQLLIDWITDFLLGDRDRGVSNTLLLFSKLGATPFHLRLFRSGFIHFLPSLKREVETKIQERRRATKREGAYLQVNSKLESMLGAWREQFPFVFNEQNREQMAETDRILLESVTIQPNLSAHEAYELRRAAAQNESETTNDAFGSSIFTLSRTDRSFRQPDNQNAAKQSQVGPQSSGRNAASPPSIRGIYRGNRDRARINIGRQPVSFNCATSKVFSLEEWLKMESELAEEIAKDTVAAASKPNIVPGIQDMVFMAMLREIAHQHVEEGIVSADNKFKYVFGGLGTSERAFPTSKDNEPSSTDTVLNSVANFFQALRD